MSARYGIGRIANSNDFGRLQRKVEDLYDTYNVRAFFLFELRQKITLHNFRTFKLGFLTLLIDTRKH